MLMRSTKKPPQYHGLPDPILSGTEKVLEINRTVDWFLRSTSRHSLLFSRRVVSTCYTGFRLRRWLSTMVK